MDESIVEITTMRKEGDYADNRRPSSIEWTDQIEEDLQRRDFTVNAMAYGMAEKGSEFSLVDPFGGQADIKAGVIRAVGDADKRFKEDGLRLMRAVRFASQLQFVIEADTFSSIKENVQLINNISGERIRDELLKILASDYPYEGVVMLRSAGLMEQIVPELERCFGVRQEGPKHDRVYDIGEHSINALKYCPSKDSVVRFATLLHDIGKPETCREQPDGNVTFYGHDVVGAKVAQLICERLRFSRKETDLVVKLVKYHMFTVDEHQTDSAIRRFIKNVGLDNIAAMFALREGDRLGGGTERPTSWRIGLFKERIRQVLTKPFSVTDLKVNGGDVMEVLAILPSRKVGEILDALFKEVSEDHTRNEREYLLGRIKSLGVQ